MRNPVATAAQMTTMPDRLSDKVYQNRLTAIDKKLEALSSKRGTLLPLEGAAISAIDDEIEDLDEKRRALVDRQSQLPYPKMSLEPLTWRNRQHYPRVVLFSPYMPHWQLIVGRNHDGRDAFQTSPEYNDTIRDLYDDVVRRLLNQIDTGTRATLTAQWEGVIPNNIKNQIAAVRQQVGEKNVFILAEPTNYTLSFKEIPKPVRVPNPDPLVVVWHGGSLYLVDKFDVTPVEHYIASEFAT